MKVENVSDRRTSTGRLFQARGPATARARSPMVERRVAGTRTSAVDAERSRRRESTSDSGWINSTDTVVLLCLDSGALERQAIELIRLTKAKCESSYGDRAKLVGQNNSMVYGREFFYVLCTMFWYSLSAR